MKLHGNSQEPEIKQVLKEFEDEIFQRPPLRSSVKRQLRTRRIYFIDYFETDGRNVLFKVGCEAGTYIRKLCFDIGEILGVGAHMQELRRTRSGSFTETSSTKVTLHERGLLVWRVATEKRPLSPAQIHRTHGNRPRSLTQKSLSATQQSTHSATAQT